MRIVHLSDLHFHAWPRDWTAVCDKRLFGLANFLVRRRAHMHPEYVERAVQRIRMLRPELIVVTGDVTCVGSPEEFATAQRRLGPLFAAPGAPPCVYVPGNHDAYVRNPRCVQALQRTFQELNQGRWNMADLPGELSFPGLRILVLNQCRPTALWQSSGCLTADARARLVAWLDRPREPGEKRILIGHFPCRNVAGRRLSLRRRFREDRLVAAALDGGRLDVALCGHHHRPFARTETGGALEVCAGALTLWGRFNVLDYVPASGRFTQRWEDVSGHDPCPVPIAAETSLAVSSAGV